MSVSRTRRCSPVATSVIRMAARLAWRSALRVERMSRFMDGPARTSIDPFHVNPDASAAGQTDPPRRLVGDAELQHPRLAVLDHVGRLRDDGALDAASGNRSEEITVLVDDEVAA